MFYEQRGPLVFSASVHLIILVGVAIWALAAPQKKPEELVFEIVEPPAGGFAQPQEEQPMQPITYQSEQVDMPTLDEIVLPERPMVPVEIPPPVVEQPKPEPVVEKVIPVEKPKPKPKPVEKQPVAAPKMSLEEFQRMQGEIKVQNVRTKPQQQKAQKIDLSADLRKLKQNLSEFKVEGLSSSQMSSSSVTSQDQLASYLSRFRAALRRAVERHPISGAPLRVTVRCDISGGGHVSNVSIVSGSGDAVFDRKVVAAFRKIRIFDAPPDNIGFNGISFELVQE